MCQYKVSIGSHVGKIRDNNEDNFFCNGLYKNDITTKMVFYNTEIFSEEFVIFSVFDGMGGIDNGEKASYISAKILEGYVNLLRKSHGKFDGEYILKKINSAICKTRDVFQGNMGSTAVILNIENNVAKLYNIGDSRGYLFSSGKLQQITVDHTEESSIRRIQKELGIQCNIRRSAKHILTQHLGIEEEEFALEPAISENICIKKGDIFLLCSDGLTDMVSDELIAKVLSQDIQLDEKRKCLTENALKAGGKDNITIVLVEAKEK